MWNRKLVRSGKLKVTSHIPPSPTAALPPFIHCAFPRISFFARDVQWGEHHMKSRSPSNLNEETSMEEGRRPPASKCWGACSPCPSPAPFLFLALSHPHSGEVSFVCSLSHFWIQVIVYVPALKIPSVYARQGPTILPVHPWISNYFSDFINLYSKSLFHWSFLYSFIIHLYSSSSNSTFPHSFCPNLSHQPMVCPHCEPT